MYVNDRKDPLGRLRKRASKRLAFEEAHDIHTYIADLHCALCIIGRGFSSLLIFKTTYLWNLCFSWTCLYAIVACI